MQDIRESVKDYYGKELQSSADLKTNACCTTVEYPTSIKKILGQIHDEVLSKYYGCGLTIPNELKGLRVLDLGSGSGRDCYLASKLVGETGYVIGVDMTDEQLDVARRHIDFHTKAFGFKKPNVEFQKATIESIDELDIPDGSLDLIISNCVINLSTDKPKVLRDCFSKLKEGGEMYFSDVYVNRRIPEHLAKDPVIYGECLGGALYWNDFLDFSMKAGFIDPRVVEAEAITVENTKLQEKLEGFEFYSVTYRLIKSSKIEKDCEDYGQAVVYKGSMEGYPKQFLLDQGHMFEKGKVHPVCGNTFVMLNETRYKDHFDFVGSFEQHYGIFPGCGTSNPFESLSSNGNSTTDSSAASCC